MITNQRAHGAFGGDARVARRASVHMFVDVAPIGLGELAVDVWGDERIDGFAVRH